MDFADQLQALANRIPSVIDHLETEEATKNALVLPFIAALGYNIFDPTEVKPELTADVGVKKGEKVDYAIMREGKPAILFECKPARADLGDAHKSQLYRYFSVTPSRIGILTNGVTYEFYSDLDEPNKLDQKPFLVVDMLDLQPGAIAELKRMTKGAYDEVAIISAAGELKYTREIRRLLEREFLDPSDDLMRYLIGQVYSGRLTERVRSEFTPIVRRALRGFLNDQVNQRLRSAIASEAHDHPPVTTGTTTETVTATESPAPEAGIITTGDEYEALYAIKAILREIIDPARITMKDRLTYCAILLDDNSRRPIARLHFGRAQWQISLFDQPDKEERVPIDNLNDLFKYSERLKATVSRYGT